MFDKNVNSCVLIWFKKIPVGSPSAAFNIKLLTGPGETVKNNKNMLWLVRNVEKDNIVLQAKLLCMIVQIKM